MCRGELDEFSDTELWHVRAPVGIGGDVVPPLMLPLRAGGIPEDGARLRPPHNPRKVEPATPPWSPRAQGSVLSACLVTGSVSG